jgi:hypothetical protein
MRLRAQYYELCEALGDTPDSSFRSSIWFKVLACLGEDHGIPVSSVHLLIDGEELDLDLDAEDLPPGPVSVSTGNDEVLATYLSEQSDRQRFCERMVRTRGGRGGTRADVLAKLCRLTATANERMMQDLGRQTYRQVLEGSFWFRLAYHCFRELGDQAVGLTPSIDQSTGQVSMAVTVSDTPFLQVQVPREAVVRLCSALDGLPGQPGLPRYPEVVRQLIRLSSDPTTGSLDLERVLRAPVRRPDGETEHELISCEQISHFCYGKLAFIPQLGALAELSPPGRIASTLGDRHRRRVERSAVPAFLERYSIDLASDADGRTGEAVGMVLLDAFDHLRIDPHILERDWCWLSLHYGSGRFDVSLADFLRLREQGQRFVETAGGWLDTEARAFEPLHAIAEQHSLDQLLDPDRGIKLSRMEMLSLCTAGFDSVQVTGDDDTAGAIRDLLQLKPAEPLQTLQGMSSSLRGYQAVGAQWLLFLALQSRGHCSYR